MGENRHGDDDGRCDDNVRDGAGATVGVTGDDCVVVVTGNVDGAAVVVAVDTTVWFVGLNLWWFS